MLISNESYNQTYGEGSDTDLIAYDPPTHCGMQLNTTIEMISLRKSKK